jgi:predicted membrane protein (TIGR00267 family)
MPRLRVQLDKLREYSELSEAGDIARRAFANNSFDGILTMTGVVMGSFFVGIEDPKIIVVTGLSTALAIGISGGWGAYLTESAERRHTMTELERFTLTDLGSSKIGRASRAAVWIVAAVDGLSPFLSAFLVVLPFLFVPLLITIATAYYAAIAMALLALFGLGLYLGTIAKENMFKMGLKTALAGVVSMGLSFLLERILG